LSDLLPGFEEERRAIEDERKHHGAVDNFFRVVMMLRLAIYTYIRMCA